MGSEEERAFVPKKEGAFAAERKRAFAMSERERLQLLSKSAWCKVEYVYITYLFANIHMILINGPQHVLVIQSKLR